MGQPRLDGLCITYIHNDISIRTGAIIKKFAATSRKYNFKFLQRFCVATIVSNSSHFSLIYFNLVAMTNCSLRLIEMQLIEY